MSVLRDKVLSLLLKASLLWLAFFAAPDPRDIYDWAVHYAPPTTSLFANSPWQACRRLLIKQLDASRTRIYIDNSDRHELYIALTPHQKNKLLRVCQTLTAGEFHPREIRRKP